MIAEPVYLPNIEDEHANHILACPRYPVAKLLHILPPKFITQLQERAKFECCRDAVKHDIEAWYSSADVRDGRTNDKGCPDIYIMYCNTCGSAHRRLCGGGSWRTQKPGETLEAYQAALNNAMRPYWEVR